MLKGRTSNPADNARALRTAPRARLLSFPLTHHWISDLPSLT